MTWLITRKEEERSQLEPETFVLFSFSSWWLAIVIHGFSWTSLVSVLQKQLSQTDKGKTVKEDVKLLVSFDFLVNSFHSFSLSSPHHVVWEVTHKENNGIPFAMILSFKISKVWFIDNREKKFDLCLDRHSATLRSSTSESSSSWRKNYRIDDNFDTNFASVSSKTNDSHGLITTRSLTGQLERRRRPLRVVREKDKMNSWKTILSCVQISFVLSFQIIPFSFI
jgi:hypothetical protein